MTTVHLAVSGGGTGSRAKAALSEGEPVACLVSYFYRSSWETVRACIKYRHWVLDSGAFTADSSGQPIDLQEYIDFCAQHLESDPLLRAVFALDVIGDPEATMRNVEEMHAQGVPAIPTVHITSPTEAMVEMKRYRKVALGGMVQRHSSWRHAFCEQAFSVLWPKWIHGFGLAAEDVLMRFPFASCDATSWETVPARFGRFRSLGKTTLRGMKSSATTNYRCEVDAFLRLERRLQSLWGPTLAKLTETL